MRFLLDHLTLILAAAAGLWIGYALVCAIRARVNRPPPVGLGEDESRAGIGTSRPGIVLMSPMLRAPRRYEYPR